MTKQTLTQVQLQWYMLGFSSSIIAYVSEKAKQDPVKKSWILATTEQITDVDAPYEPYLLSQPEHEDIGADTIRFCVLLHPIKEDSEGKPVLTEDLGIGCFEAYYISNGNIITYHGLDDSIGKVVYDIDKDEYIDVEKEDTHTTRQWEIRTSMNTRYVDDKFTYVELASLRDHIMHLNVDYDAALDEVMYFVEKKYKGLTEDELAELTDRVMAEIITELGLETTAEQEERQAAMDSLLAK